MISFKAGLTHMPEARNLLLPCAGRAKARMQWLRTITSFVRVLVALFVITQFAGVVPSPLASAEAYAGAVALHVQHQHLHLLPDQRESADRHSNPSGGHVDRCCALHAFFAGLLPSLVAIETTTPPAQQLLAHLAESRVGIVLGRLDRPPKISAVI
jgi:hypothetical protein